MAPSSFVMRPRRAAAWATGVLIIALALIWTVAVPHEPACPAAGPGAVACSEADRQAAGVRWTVVVTAAYVMAAATAMTVGRRYRWGAAAALTLFVVVAVVAFGAVQGSTGYVAL